MTILFFGIYNPQYSRNRVLMKGLEKNGIKIIECNDRSRSFIKYVRLIWKYLKDRPQFDAMIVGFPGQEAMFLARFLTRKPIIFDTFTSHYGGHILDRRKYPKKSLQAKFYRFLDKWSCKLADLALLDTQTHIDFFVKEYNLPRDKFKRVFVGTDSDIFHPMDVAKDVDKFTVHFHGHFIPLQGAEYIIRAANILKDENIIFQIIGRGQEYEKVRSIADEFGLTNIVWIDSVSYEELPKYINRGDICLGGFGSTEKAKHVSMNKLFEYMACGKPIINGDSPGVKEFLEDGKTVVFCKRADEKSLAEAIIKLKNNEAMRAELASNARKEFEEKYKPEIIVKDLISYVQNQ